MFEESVNYFSKDYFRDYYKSKRSEFKTNNKKDGYQKVPLDQYFDVFLSYNIRDKKAVTGIYYALKNQGLSVYLDFMVDPDMKRTDTTINTANTIHERLLHSSSLIYAQSSNAHKSNWMPWELGIVDGNRGKCIIMPVQCSEKAFTPQREYTMLYPVIGYDELMQIRVYEKHDSSSRLLDLQYIRSTSFERIF